MNNFITEPELKQITYNLTYSFSNLVSNVESSAESYSKGCDILTRNGEVESTPNCFMKRPFVCKVDAKDAPYDSQCGVYSTRKLI